MGITATVQLSAIVLKNSVTVAAGEEGKNATSQDCPQSTIVSRARVRRPQKIAFELGLQSFSTQYGHSRHSDFSKCVRSGSGASACFQKSRIVTTLSGSSPTGKAAAQRKGERLATRSINNELRRVQLEMGKARTTYPTQIDSSPFFGTRPTKAPTQRKSSISAPFEQSNRPGQPPFHHTPGDRATKTPSERTGID